MDGAPRVLMTFPEDLARKAEGSLVRLGVQVRAGVMVRDIKKEGLTIESGNQTEWLPARTVIWAGGVTTSSLGRTLANRTGAETDKGGRIKVEPDLTIPNFPDIYVIGDLAHLLDHEGRQLPGVAQVAMQQGTYAGNAVARKVEGKRAQPPFRYFDKGNLAVIGRAAAVADIFGLRVSGLFAWLVWAFVHLMYLVQFQSRILVFIQWAIQDLTFNRGARLITGVAATDFNFNTEVASENDSRGTDGVSKSS